MSTTRIEKYLNNEDVMKVAYKAASTFSKVLSQDEIKSCVMNALWKADANYDEANTTKFTSYLHKGVVFECLTQRKFNQRKGGEKTLSHLIGDKRDYFSAIDFKDAIDTKCDDPTLIYDKFYKDMTFEEMGKERGVCGERIRQRVEKNLAILREVFQ